MSGSCFSLCGISASGVASAPLVGAIQGSAAQGLLFYEILEVQKFS